MSGRLAGKVAVVVGAGQTPGDTIGFICGATPGVGPCPTVYQSECLGIVSPRFLGTAGTRGKRVACLLTDTTGEVSPA